MDAKKKSRIIFDSLKELETIEIQEEEKYILNLKIQREKIEEFRQELAKKTNLIKGLEEELNEWKGKKAEFDNCSAEINYLSEELKESEIENAKLRATISAQVDEYDTSIHELKQVVMKEREEKSREISYLRSEIRVKEEDTEILIQALEKAKNTMQMFEARCEAEVKSAKEKELSAIELLKSLKSSERALREEVNALRQENLSHKETIRILQERTNKQNSIQDDLENAVLSLSEEKRKNKEIRRCFAEATEKYEVLKRNIENEFNGLKEELDQAIEIISRQETSLQDLRLRKQEDDSKIMYFNKELEFKNQEIAKVQQNYSKVLQQQEANLETISELEFKVNCVTAENSQMKAELKKNFDKQEQERDERKKIARKKLDLLTQRNEEISRLNQAFSTFDN